MNPIYVDLDGTLLQGDSLHEGCLRLLAKPCAWPQGLRALAAGKASFKGFVSQQANLEVSTLTYRTELISWLCAQKACGRRLFLATGANSATALAVAEHLGIFDGVLASDLEINLTGGSKLAAIQTHAAGGQFCYVGDGLVDLQIWEKSASAVLVGGAVNFEPLVGSTKVEAKFPNKANVASEVIRQLRPYQWAKNTLVFLPALTAHCMLEPAVLSTGLMLFAAFSLCASGAYAANDLLDLSSDRTVPHKRIRPLANGTVTIPVGLGLALLLPCASLVLGWIAAGWAGAWTLAGYWVLTTYYSLHGKQIVLLDVFILAGLYTFRAYAGSLSVPNGMSGWMTAFLLFLFLSLACLKRFSELLNLERIGTSNLAGRGYRAGDHHMLGAFGIGAGFAATLVVCLYANSDAVRILYAEPLRVMALAPLVLFGLGRLWLHAWRSELQGDPVLHALKDWVSYLLLSLCALIMLLAAA